MLAHQMDETLVIEKKSSWPFSRSKHKKGATLEWPEEFLCPITKSLMADPVIIASGETYERQCIQIWLQQGNRHCFKSGATLDNESLTPNMALRSAIHAWCEKRRVPKPQAPTFEGAKELVESSASRAARSNGNVSTTAPFSGNPARAGSGSEPASSGSCNAVCRLGFQGNLGNEQRSGNGNVQPQEQVGQSTWTSQKSIGPLWKRQTHSYQPTGSSVEFDRKKNSSTEYNGSSGKEPSLLSSSYTDHNSSEWPNSPGQRYVHSASANILREHSDGAEPRGRTPLVLETTPSSYQTGEAGQSEEGVGIAEELIYKLRHQHAIEQEEAAAEVRRLTRNGDPTVDYRLFLCTPELLGALMPLLQSRYSGVQVNAVAAIMNLSLASENKVKIARAGAIPALIDVLKSRPDEAQEHAAGALFSLALNDENKMAIGVLGAIPPLIHVLRIGSSAARQDAAMALYHLSFAHINRGKLIKAGAVVILLQLVQEESSDLVSRALLILSNLAAVQEGRSVICEGHGIAVFVSLIKEGLIREDPLMESNGPGM